MLTRRVITTCSRNRWEKNLYFINKIPGGTAPFFLYACCKRTKINPFLMLVMASFRWVFPRMFLRVHFIKIMCVNWIAIAFFCVKTQSMYKYKIIKHTCGFGVNHLNLDGFYDMPTHSSGRFLMLCAPAFFLKKKRGSVKQVPWCRWLDHGSLTKLLYSSFELLRHHIMILVIKMGIQGADRTINVIVITINYSLDISSP